jgi:hypothetical protein
MAGGKKRKAAGGRSKPKSKTVSGDAANQSTEQVQGISLDDSAFSALASPSGQPVKRRTCATTAGRSSRQKTLRKWPNGLVK